MNFDGRISMSLATMSKGISSALSPSLSEDALWQMNLRAGETMESGQYPERPGEPDCSYYIRTGLCRFGATCRFNHPPDRKLAIATARMKGEYPERIGQPECQYYMKTGTCKFGATCKFHHPREKAGVALNIFGYPLRKNEAECAYYSRTGQCKFGSTCKFHHPQPTNMTVSLRGSPAFPTAQSPSTSNQHSYHGGPSFIPSPRWQGSSSYAPLVIPQGMVSVSGWNAYSRQPGSMPSSEQTGGNNQIYGTSNQSELANPLQAALSPFSSGSVPVGFYALQRANVFPERPGQPECQFYMKTGDCKFGAVCRFHHPRDRVLPPPDCILSPLGLPLRPGEPLCVFYSQYGICKFGPSCKFDHPMGILAQDLSASSSADDLGPVFLSSSGTTALNFSNEALVEAVSVKTRRLSLSETRQMLSDEDDIDDTES